MEFQNVERLNSVLSFLINFEDVSLVTVHLIKGYDYITRIIFKSINRLVNEKMFRLNFRMYMEKYSD